MSHTNTNPKNPKAFWWRNSDYVSISGKEEITQIRIQIFFFFFTILPFDLVIFLEMRKGREGGRKI